MTELLNKAIQAAQQLSPEEQDALGREMLERISADARWDQAFADPFRGCVGSSRSGRGNRCR
jgi:hypothetical protein